MPVRVRDNIILLRGPYGGNTLRICQELKRLAAGAGVTDRVIFAGKQPHDVVPLYYQSADLSVLASWREGCPNTVLESLAWLFFMRSSPAEDLLGIERGASSLGKASTSSMVSFDEDILAAVVGDGRLA